MKTTTFLLSILFAGFFISCGEAELDLDSSDYDPKIVVEGYLIPGQTPSNIRISRNFPLNKPIDLTSVSLPAAMVLITRQTDNRQINLTYDPLTMSYRYAGTDFVTDHATSYQLTVSAVIDGKPVTASASTTTPSAGFSILDSVIPTNHLSYSAQSPDGTDSVFSIPFSPSSGIDFYALSITAQDASIRSFIYSPVNRYEDIAEKDSSKVREDLNFRKYQSDAILNVPGSGLQKRDLEWFYFQFYGRYRIIMYAMDVNAKNYFLTHKDVQDFDGNFVEPRMAIEGDGIGVFGSVIADTVYFNVLRP
ncbi:MAG: DUF4249 family protein [Bacteroidetes bacterium]|nr:DUF4249 family protein [Bacteroidota bacterium]